MTFPKPWTWPIEYLPPMQTRWVAWLALTQLSLAALCIFAIRAKMVYKTQAMLVGCAIWFTLQGVDEVLAGNLFGTLWVEYPILLTGIIATHLHLKRHDRKTG